MSISDLILKNMQCAKCGAGYGKCDCWQKCTCGWSHAKDEKCNNPDCETFGGKKRPLQAIATGKIKL